MPTICCRCDRMQESLVLYQNDDHGKDYLKGFKDGLGAQAARIVSEVSYAAERSYGGLPGGDAASVGRRCVHEFRHRQGGSAGDS